MDKNDKTEPTQHLGVLLGEADANGAQGIAFERDGRLDMGVLHPLEEGKPLPPGSEFVEVEHDGVFAVVKNHGRLGRATSQGPAMVNDDSFRQGWQRIFGNKNATLAQSEMN